MYCVINLFKCDIPVSYGKLFTSKGGEKTAELFSQRNSDLKSDQLSKGCWFYTRSGCFVVVSLEKTLYDSYYTIAINHICSRSLYPMCGVK